MKISSILDDLLDDLAEFEPQSLGQIVWFTRNHKHFVKVCMLARNSSKSAQYLLDQYECLDTEDDLSDLQLAALIVIIGEIENQKSYHIYDKLVSRASNGAGNSKWSRGMATTYLLHKEVTSETVRKSA